MRRIQNIASPGILLIVIALSVFGGVGLVYPHSTTAQAELVLAKSSLDQSGMPSLNGKDAIQFLKQEGVFDSLNDAVTKAGFGANAIPITTQQAQLVAPDGAASDTFGWSIAISGETVVVGSQFGDGGGVFNQGAVHVFVRTGTVWSLQQKLLPVDGTPGQLFGGSVAIDGDTVVIGSPQATISGNMFQGAVYVFARTGSVWSQQQKLTAFDGAAQDQFGQVVSISRDTLVVSAKFADVGGNTDQGAAYVFVRTGVTWSLQQKITAADGQASDNFGTSVAIHHETLAIGATGDDIGPALNRGSVTILVRVGTTWNVQQVVTTPDGISGINFGVAVAIQSDTLAVGANGFFDSNTVSVTGAVFLFTRIGTSWSLQQRVGPSVATSGGQFGFSVVLSGETLVVGSSGATVGVNTGQGAVYVFVRTGATWVEQQRVVAPDGVTNDRFGQSVGISGETVVAGAYLKLIGSNTFQGAAYVFACTAANRNWTQQAGLVSIDGSPGDQLGFSVAISGETAVVGVPQDDFGSNFDQGSAYVFLRIGTTWVQQQKLTAADGAMNDQFGFSVAISGETIVVGAHLDDTVATSDHGSAYVFVRTGGTWSQQQKLTASSPASGDRFGAAVGISEDTLVVGAVQDDVGANPDQGSASVFTRTGSVWSLQQQLTATGGAASDLFGASVAIEYNTLVVGAPFDDASSANDGSVLVFVRSGTTWSQQQQLTAPDAADGDGFGSAVALNRETIVVGAPGDDSPANADQGSAYVFVRTVATWSHQQKLIAVDGAASDGFGYSVGLSGEIITIGARLDDEAFADQGSAYVFERAGTIWSQDQKLVLPDGSDTDRFGTSVATQDGTILVGCPLDELGGTFNVGSVRVFVRDCPQCSSPTGTVTGGATICAGGSATVSVVVSGGTPPFTVTLDNGGGTQTGASPLVFTVSPVANTTYAIQSGTDTGGCPIIGSGSAAITVTAAPTVNAGPDQTVCAGNPQILLAGSFGGSAVSCSWSGGGGAFSPNNTTTTASYTPTPAEVAAGTVTLTLTALPAGGCSPVMDSMTITLTACSATYALMVADTTNNRIQGFNGTTWSVLGPGTVGAGPGQFRVPEAVTFDSRNWVYVADTGNNRIQRSTDGGVTWAVFAALGSGFNQVRAPQGVAVDTAGNLYVADTGNGRVLRFNGGVPGNGVVLSTQGTASHQVGSPRGLAIDSTFRLFVADESNSRILRILSANTVTSATTGTIIATSGTALNKVKNPQGIAIDSAGTLYIADTGNSRILQWANASPASASTMGLMGTGLGQVNRPEGITVTQFASGPYAGGPMLVIGDTSNNRIQGRLLPTGIWTLVGLPNGNGTAVGQFRAPSKIR